MRFYRSKFFIICISVAIMLVLIPSALSVFGYTDVLRSAVKTVAHPFEWCGAKAMWSLNPSYITSEAAHCLPNRLSSCS